MPTVPAGTSLAELAGEASALLKQAGQRVAVFESTTVRVPKPSPEREKRERPKSRERRGERREGGLSCNGTATSPRPTLPIDDRATTPIILTRIGQPLHLLLSSPLSSVSVFTWRTCRLCECKETRQLFGRAREGDGTGRRGDGMTGRQGDGTVHTQRWAPHREYSYRYFPFFFSILLFLNFGFFFGKGEIPTFSHIIFTGSHFQFYDPNIFPAEFDGYLHASLK